MGSAKVIIENVFGSLKNRWRILKIFNLNVNKVVIVIIACCVLHNYCEMWKVHEPNCVNDATKRDNLAGFRVDRLPTLKDGKQAKQA
jgi:hypothetical protein